VGFRGFAQRHSYRGPRESVPAPPSLRAGAYSRYSFFRMKVDIIDGPSVGKALIAGAYSLMEKSSELNKINVFPVPDGDTGTNMASTVEVVLSTIPEPVPGEVGKVLDIAAHSMLGSSRGNSGAILAQFMLGLASELRDEAAVTVERFSHAAMTAAQKAKHALREPKEGTILTVLEDWARALHTRAQKTQDFLRAFLHAGKIARASCDKTIDILPEMKKAHVVDAGAKGFVHILEGIEKFLRTGSIPKPRASAAHVAAQSALHVEGPVGELRFCTEAMIAMPSIRLDALREAVAAYGDSVVVAGDESICRIHVHTARPGELFDYLDTIGSVSAHKVDDMLLQERIAARVERKCAIVVDTACDMPEAERLSYGIERVPLILFTNGKARCDGEGFDLERLHERMAHDPSLTISTSQPAEAAFERAFSIALSTADEVVYLGFSAALSGTFEAGRRASERFGSLVRCVDGREITSGYGLLARKAAELAESGANAATIAEAIEVWRKRLLLYVSVPNLTSLIRTGRLSGVKGLVLTKLGIRPIISPSEEGKAVSGGMYLGERHGVRKLAAIIKKKLPAGARASVLISHVNARAEAEKLRDAIGQYLAPAESIEIVPMGPLLASLAWLGAVGIAVLSEEENR